VRQGHIKAAIDALQHDAESWGSLAFDARAQNK
jgi:hypothetical protein